MPLQRLLGYGLLTVGMVACAAMIVIALLAKEEAVHILVPAVLGFAGTTIAGVLAVLNKLESLEEKLTGNSNRMQELRRDVQKCLDDKAP